MPKSETDSKKKFDLQPRPKELHENADKARRDKEPQGESGRAGQNATIHEKLPDGERGITRGLRINEKLQGSPRKQDVVLVIKNQMGRGIRENENFEQERGRKKPENLARGTVLAPIVHHHDIQGEKRS